MLIILLIVLAAIFLSNIPGDMAKNHCEKLHKWVLRDDPSPTDGYLICKTCGKKPGDD